MIVETNSDNTVFSSEVRLVLDLDGQTIPVATVGPERFVLVAPQQLHGTDACLVITIDGEPRRCPIRVETSRQPAREYRYTRR